MTDAAVVSGNTESRGDGGKENVGMTRMEALEAVAEAAEILVNGAGTIRGRTPEDADTYTHELRHIQELILALSALDALPAQPQGETVTLGLWAHADGQIAMYVAGSTYDQISCPGWSRLGTVTLPLDREGGE